MIFRKSLLRQAVLFSSLLVAPRFNAATFYVAPGGSDSNPGTQAQPLASLQRGLNTVAAGDTIILSAGDYYGTNYSRVNGSPNNVITIQGQPGAWLRCTNGVGGGGDNNLKMTAGLTISNSWYVVRGLNFYSNYLSLSGLSASHNLLESNWLERTRAITFEGAPNPLTNGPSFNTIRYNVFTNMVYCIAAMGVSGFNNNIDTNIWWTSNDNDAINRRRFI